MQALVGLYQLTRDSGPQRVAAPLRPAGETPRKSHANGHSNGHSQRLNAEQLIPLDEEDDEILTSF